MGLVKLAIDRQNKRLVSFNGSVTEFPPFYQTNEQEFRIQVVDPSGGPFTTTYTAVDCTGLQLRLVIVEAVTGGEDDPLAALFEGDWTYDTGNDWYEGIVNFNTAEMETFLTGVASADAVLEINLMSGGIPTTIIGGRSGDKNITINANGDDVSATEPTPVDSYYTQSQTEALWLSGSGSPEGVKTAGVGRTYWDTTGKSLWVKDSGTGNTGWYQVVG